jgi:hypothetical protein
MGGNSGKAAQAEATKQEAERQARIANATKRIDSIFSAPGRERQYQDYGQATNALYLQDANRQKTNADRLLRFAMARGGLTGGSAALAGGRNVRDEYTRGVLEAARRSQAGVADLRSQDNAARLNLIQLANAGTDATSAAQNAAAAMRTNLAAAQTGAVAGGLGDIFGTTAELYKRQQEAAERRRAQQAPLGTLYGQYAMRP